LPGHDPRRSTPQQRNGGHHKIALQIKRGIHTAAKRHGRDGKGSGGLDGYFEFLAAKHPKVFAGLLGRLLPVHLKTDEAAGVSGGFVVNIVGVPSGVMFSKDEVAEMALDELPPLLEHEPAVIDNDDDPSSAA
jgi:hypothetical protein